MSEAFDDDCYVIVAHGGAKPTDTHLASRIVCIDEEIHHVAEAA
jgi:hypothetical protein